MDLINDLGTELAFAFLVEKRYQQKIDSEEALELISRIQTVLESASGPEPAETRQSPNDLNRPFSAH
jgi:hypothetical protein